MTKSITKSKAAAGGRSRASRTGITRSQSVTDHLRASESVMKDVLASKESSVAFLVKAGILNKSGKGLAKPYR